MMVHLFNESRVCILSARVCDELYFLILRILAEASNFCWEITTYPRLGIFRVIIIPGVCAVELIGTVFLKCAQASTVYQLPYVASCVMVTFIMYVKHRLPIYVVVLGVILPS